MDTLRVLINLHHFEAHHRWELIKDRLAPVEALCSVSDGGLNRILSFGKPEGRRVIQLEIRTTRAWAFIER